MKFAFFLAAAAAAASAAAQELVTVPSRPGVTQSFVIGDMGARKAQAVALLYVGGIGDLRLRMEDGRPVAGTHNFLVRAQADFVRDGVLPVLLAGPSDHGELPDRYRMADEQTVDARAVVAELKKRYPGLPVFIVGTSRGTLSAAYVGRALGSDVAGVVLSASVLRHRGEGGAFSLESFDFSSIKAPLLFVHHRDDGCRVTPYALAARLADRYPLVSVRGGKPAESAPCEALSQHGFYGREAETVDAIAAWMLKRPFPKEIE